MVHTKERCQPLNPVFRIPRCVSAVTESVCKRGHWGTTFSSPVLSVVSGGSNGPSVGRPRDNSRVDNGMGKLYGLVDDIRSLRRSGTPTFLFPFRDVCLSSNLIPYNLSSLLSYVLIKYQC